MRKILLANAALTLILVVLMDVAGYFLLPERYVASFPRYRREFRLVDPIMDGLPRWYYVADPVRGFELGKNVKAQYLVEGNLFSVWTNSIGCFDREHFGDSLYVYFAGDSFTWGHVPYEDNFGTLIEASTGTPIYKCGIEHTGQRHQLDKLINIIEHGAAVPKAIFVFHFDNDIANDYSYPHSTVIDGWLVDAVVADSNHVLIHRSREELSSLINARIRNAAIQLRSDSAAFRDPLNRLRRKVSQYSITANIVRATVHKFANGGAPTRPTKYPKLNLYNIPSVVDGRYWYRNNPYARANQQALLAFKAWSEDHGVALVVVLIPRHEVTFKPEFKAELHSFLKFNGIRFMDLAGVFAQRKLRPEDLYWREDPHFNVTGNAATARALVDSFPQYLGSADRTSLRISGH